MGIYRALDVFFFAFHSGLVFFLVFGWVPRRSRPAHLIVTGLTAASWFGLGLWFGIGYCPCTDWHWRVRAALGDTELPRSYLKFILDSLTGWNANARIVDWTAFAVFLLVSGISLALNGARFVARRRERP